MTASPDITTAPITRGVARARLWPIWGVLAGVLGLAGTVLFDERPASELEAAARGESIVAEDANYPLYTAKQGDKETKGWYHPAARLITGFAPQEPKLAFDIVPAGKPGEFKLFFKGKAMPKAKVALVTQSGWMKEGYTDADGLVKFEMPWKGTYVAEASHTDRTPGERPGAGGAEKYDTVSYVTTLTYVKADGVAAVPAGPVATPNK